MPGFSGRGRWALKKCSWPSPLSLCNFGFVIFLLIIFHSQLCCFLSFYSLESSKQAAVTLYVLSTQPPPPPPWKRREHPLPVGLGLGSCCNLRKEGKRPGLLSQQWAPCGLPEYKSLAHSAPSLSSFPSPAAAGPSPIRTHGLLGKWQDGSPACLRLIAAAPPIQ